MNYVWKMRRAREHLREMEEQLRWWFEGDPYRVTEEIDAQADTKSILVVADRQPPDRLPLVLGDLIQNLRSGLDHLIGDLARSAASGYLMPSVEEGLAFPITTSRRAFKQERVKGRLGCVPPRAQALIQRTQPYRAGDHWNEHFLWVLHQLSNIDKHRQIHVVTSVMSGLAIQDAVVEDAEWIQLGGGLGPFKEKAVLVTVRPAKAKMDVNLDSVSVDVVFGEGSPASGKPVLHSTTELANHVATLVVRLREYL